MSVAARKMDAGDVAIPKPVVDLKSFAAERDKKLATENSGVKKMAPKEQSSLLGQNGQIIGMTVGLITILSLVFFAGWYVATTNSDIKTMQQQIQDLKSNKDAEQERKFEEYIQKAKVSGYQLGVAETEQDVKKRGK